MINEVAMAFNSIISTKEMLISSVLIRGTHGMVSN
jgi:hypothetical protein